MFVIDNSEVGLHDTYSTFSISIMAGCPRLQLKRNVLRFVVESSSKSALASIQVG